MSEKIAVGARVRWTIDGGGAGTVLSVGESPTRGGTTITVEPDDQRRPLALYDGEWKRDDA